ncbi:ELMO domain-containing protein 3-like isoform X2 [Zootermopsis nevadensis]|uniref:ELMO domain-containing protein 3-like isoform X2 n=1 Tax=Zootermopsis nevadensis TaxID=136037 RepID=UPI000B8EE013|nr:ELMO domain-containing protein 3-like isoform X2 [Zootermopsis nevadensis]
MGSHKYCHVMVFILQLRLACEGAMEEWDSVATVETAFRNSLEPRHSVMPHITVHQALVFFQAHVLSVQLTEVRGSVEPRGLCTLLSCLLGPPELHDHLMAERDLVFAIAQCKLDMSEPVHLRMLRTVYRRLTGAQVDCPRYGSHWEHIGFQGTDPGTDLRGVGMLGLLQLLYLSNSPHLFPLARDIYRVSADDRQNFPLAAMSLNMTRIALQALRHGELNRECNHHQLVMEVVNQFYAAVFHHTLHIWTSQHKTIRDSGYVLKDVEFYCRGNVRAVLRDLREQLASYASARSCDKPCLPGSFQDLLTQAKTEVFI